MRGVLGVFGLLAAAAVGAQERVYVCPMDPDVRSSRPGMCKRCGMKLAAGLPDLAAYPVDLEVTPRALRAGQKERLEFTVRDPWKDRPVTRFQKVHERLFHLFVVSQDLEFFAHDHPVLEGGGRFALEMAFPAPGMYRMLTDFYPEGGTPQLIEKTVVVPGTAPSARELGRDYAPKDSANLHIEMSTDPPRPVAGMKTMLVFQVSPAKGLEQYLGAWGHMLAASGDLIDLIHTHPFLANGPRIQFNVEFPRAQTYRVWVQFQRKGVVNTARFDVPVGQLE